MSLPTWKVAELKLSVAVNGVFMAFNKVKQSLRRFVRPMTFYNVGADPLTEISIKGSCHLLNYKGRLILLATNHQLKDDEKGNVRRLEEIVLVANQTSDNPKLLLSASEATRVRFPPEADLKAAEDIVILEFDPAKYSLDPTTLFWKLGKTALLGDVSPTQIDGIFTIGFPSEFSGYDFEFDEDAGTGTASYSSKPCLLYLTSNPESELERHLAFNVEEGSKAAVKDWDGFSGAPVFFVHHDSERNYFVGYAGMITRGSNGKFHVYDAKEIFALLEGP